LPDRKVKKVKPVQLAQLPDRKVKKVKPVQLAQLPDRKDLLDHKDLSDRKDRKDQQVQMDMMQVEVCSLALTLLPERFLWEVIPQKKLIWFLVQRLPLLTAMFVLVW
jgi:hypothetical protein